MRPRDVATAAVVLAAILVAGRLFAEVLELQGGGRIEGKVIKRTPEAVFVDVGYTILAIPAKELKGAGAEVLTGGTGAPAPVPVSKDEAGRPASSGVPRAEAVPSPGAAAPAMAGERREGIYSSREKPEAGSIKDQAREVSEGVVQVICPGKMGSGFIINDEGHVVTNCHVVEGDQDIAVVIYVREEHDLRKVRLERVKIIALNPFLDLALLKIEEDDAPGAKKEVPRLQKTFLGDSEAVRVGDPVFAIGSPLGLERTVTEGIVSNNRRALEGLIYVQTSAPINPGNSGGPLFNDRGEVVGINSLKATFGESLGFAIPVNYLKDFLRNREAFAFEKDNPNTGIRYLPPPRKAAAGRREL